MNPIESEVEAAIDRIFKGSLRDVVSDTGGKALCLDATIELGRILKRGKIRVVDLKYRSTRYRTDVGRTAWEFVNMFQDPTLYQMIVSYGESDEWHAILDCDDYLIDLTAKQFDSRLPFPYIVYRN